MRTAERSICEVGTRSSALLVVMVDHCAGEGIGDAGAQFVADKLTSDASVRELDLTGAHASTNTRTSTATEPSG